MSTTILTRPPKLPPLVSLVVGLICIPLGATIQGMLGGVLLGGGIGALLCALGLRPLSLRGVAAKAFRTIILPSAHQQHMKHRKLRIAWSTVWGVLAVLLCVLWVRSYWWWDNFSVAYSGTRCLFAALYRGTVVLHPYNRGPGEGLASWSLQVPHDVPEGDRNYDSNVRPFRWLPMGNLTLAFVLPIWISVLFVLTLSVLPWLTFRRFSLRTLLLAVTLGSIVLGVVVWAVRG